MAAGFMVTWQSEWILQNFGANAWADRTFGSDGGSRLLYKLIGIVVILVGVLYLTGLWQGIALSIAKSVFNIK